MQALRFDDDECVSAIGYFLRSVLGAVQMSFMLFMLLMGSIFGGLGAACIQTWDRGMDMLGRKRIVMDSTGSHVHFIRYYLLYRDRDDRTDFNVFIHRILRTDEGCLHDHPWGYRTLVLSGGYWETTGTAGRDAATGEATVGDVERRWRGPGFTHKVSDSHAHRLALEKNEETGADVPCWTVFVPFRRTQEWGFYVDGEGGSVWEPAARHLGGARASAEAGGSDGRVAEDEQGEDEQGEDEQGEDEQGEDERGEEEQGDKKND